MSQTLNFRAPVKIGDVVGASVEVAELVEKGHRVNRSAAAGWAISWCRKARRW